MIKIQHLALQGMKRKAQNNPAVIIRNSFQTYSFDVVFKYLRYNDTIASCVSFEDAVDIVQQINQTEEENQ